MARIPHLEEFLPECARLVRGPLPMARIDSVAGWGFKATSLPARLIADRLGVPYIALEDGFLRSVGLGGAGAPPMSLTVDDLGIHYDASRPSRLENLLASGELDDPALLDRGRNALDAVIAHGLSKTNTGADMEWPARKEGRRRVLVVDQTAGDVSIRGGLADRRSFARLLEAALDEERGAEIFVRRHPARAAGLKRGCLPETLPAGVGLIDGNIRAAAILAGVDKVYTVSSLLGFEALIRGLDVRAFGLPFWAGWGASSDELSSPRRSRRLSALQIFCAACVLYARYVDPLTAEACGLETAIERLALFRHRAMMNAGFTAAVGFAPWKHAPARTLLGSPLGRVRFFRQVEAAVAAAEQEKGRVVFWAGRETDAIAARLARSKAPVVRMEDGFIRSRGLGSDFHPASSAVLDDIGIYYDATAPSRLEGLLEEGGFASELLARARALRERLVAAGLSKYNLDRPAPTVPWPDNRTRLLVVGQVENDKSIQKGCEGVASNLALLEAARRARPEAFILFKPHPDVEAGNRPGAAPRSEVERFADAIAEGADILSCIEECEELATMTSLAGFEALLRGKRVLTFGRPFYAGWGLTVDALDFPRRRRRVALDELVAAVLLLYPIYIDPASGLPCEAERLVESLEGCAGPAGPPRWRHLRAVKESIRRAPGAHY
ncbi:MAG: capsular polysaccharide biosynthesis protein [Caulobacteraceae bacterium]